MFEIREKWFSIRLKIHYWITWCLFPRWTELRLKQFERVIGHDAYVCGLCESIISGQVIRKKKIRSCPVCNMEN